MEIDESDENSKNAEALQRLISKGPLPSALSRLSGSSRGIPFEKDFHFYNNFSEFKSPIKLSDENSSLALKKIGSAKKLWGTGKGTTFPEDSNDLELEPYDWLVNLNDDVLETFDVSLDEFKETRKKEEESGVRIMKMGMDDDTDGFQMVHGKNKNKREAASSGGSGGVEVGGNVQVATKVEAKVHFHIASVPRPQDVYKIIMNNSNQPFEHVWFEKTEDGSKSIHPLEKFSPLDFVDKNVENIEPIKPPPLESTPFMFVEEVKDLKILATKLRNADEFAVDLEHNQYRSFQGLTCLMQISTRTEDFVVDTLKLRIHIGPYLRDVFKDPTKKKVLHGSDRDIVWLQRDFGIYICNMFDTGQASRILKLERNSLEHLLQHFCEVKANKEYQNAEWRRRPLPQEMIKYAREDTHYLLYIYDVMRLRLNELTPETEESDPPLIEVYKRSYDLCMQLYEKELFTDDSYLRMFGLRDADLKAEQLAVVAGLYEWRDVVARAEDESTGYILPNKILIEIGKQMPLTANKLKYLLKSMHSYCSHIERNLGSVVSIIRHSMQNAAHFEPAVQHLKELKEQRLLKASEENAALNEALNEASEVLPSENSETITEDTSVKVASVEVVKKKSSAFGALLGNSAKRKFQSDNSNKEAEQMKLEKIISEVNLPFHAFVEKEEVEEESLPVKNDEEQVKNDEFPFTFNNSNGPESELKMEGGDENISLTELSSSFNQCFKSINETRKGNNSSGKSIRENEVLPELEPFDYEAAREQIKFGKAPCGGGGGDGEVGKGKRGKGQKKGGVSLTMKEEDDLLPQGKRRQAFPASGNRSATFR